MEVSVIVPCWNYGRFLEEAVASVLRQSVTDLEVIIIDDGSEDETPDVVANLEKVDSRVRSFRTAHLGPAHARNLGTAEARGEYVAFLDSDDRWRPTKLASQLSLMKSEPNVVMHFTNVRWFTDGVELDDLFQFLDGLNSTPTRASGDGAGWVINGDPFLALLRLPILGPIPSATMLRVSRVRELKWRDGLHPAEDYEYFTRVSALGDVAFTDQVLVEARRHGNNSFGDRVTPPRSWIKAFNGMLRADAESLSEDHRRALRAKVGRIWSGLGWHYFWRRSPGRSALAYLRALGYTGVRANAAAHLLALPAVPFLPSKAGQDRSFK